MHLLPKSEIDAILAETRAVAVECGRAISLHWKLPGQSLEELVYELWKPAGPVVTDDFSAKTGHECDKL